MKKESVEKIIKENASGGKICFTFTNDKTQSVSFEDIVIKDDYIELREGNRKTYLDANSITKILITEQSKSIDHAH